MAGPLSAPAGHGRAPHDKCQDRENCHGPGCRVRTGKTEHVRRGGAVPYRQTATPAELGAESENAA